MKFTYFLTITLSSLICNTSAYSKALCEKREGLQKPTIRAFNGALCGIKSIAAWAEKNCTTTPGYTESQCHKKALTALKNTDIASLTAGTTGNETTIDEILKGSASHLTDEDKQLLRKSSIFAPSVSDSNQKSISVGQQQKDNYLQIAVLQSGKEGKDGITEIEKRIKEGGDISTTSGTETLLHLAARARGKEINKFLIDLAIKTSKINMKAENQSGQTALALATRNKIDPLGVTQLYITNNVTKDDITSAVAMGRADPSILIQAIKLLKRSDLLEVENYPTMKMKRN